MLYRVKGKLCPLSTSAAVQRCVYKGCYDFLSFHLDSFFSVPKFET